MNQFFERRYVIAGVFITLIIILLARLFYIQIIDDRYLLYAQNNVLRRVYTNPARGPILDRNKKLLVQNQAFYDIMVIPKEVKQFDTTEFCKLLNITKDDFDKQFTKAIKYSRSVSSIFEKQLSPQVYAAFQERLSEFPALAHRLPGLFHRNHRAAGQGRQQDLRPDRLRQCPYQGGRRLLRVGSPRALRRHHRHRRCQPCPSPPRAAIEAGRQNGYSGGRAVSDPVPAADRKIGRRNDFHQTDLARQIRAIGRALIQG